MAEQRSQYVVRIYQGNNKWETILSVVEDDPDAPHNVLPLKVVNKAKQASKPYFLVQTAVYSEQRRAGRMTKPDLVYYLFGGIAVPPQRVDHIKQEIDNPTNGVPLRMPNKSDAAKSPFRNNQMIIDTLAAQATVFSKLIQGRDDLYTSKQIYTFTKRFLDLAGKIQTEFIAPEGIAILQRQHDLIFKLLGIAGEARNNPGGLVDPSTRNYIQEITRQVGQALPKALQYGKNPMGVFEAVVTKIDDLVRVMDQLKAAVTPESIKTKAGLQRALKLIRSIVDLVAPIMDMQMPNEVRRAMGEGWGSLDGVRRNLQKLEQGDLGAFEFRGTADPIQETMNYLRESATDYHHALDLINGVLDASGTRSVRTLATPQESLKSAARLAVTMKAGSGVPSLEKPYFGNPPQDRSSLQYRQPKQGKLIHHKVNIYKYQPGQRVGKVARTTDTRYSLGIAKSMSAADHSIIYWTRPITGEATYFHAGQQIDPSDVKRIAQQIERGS